MGHGIYVFLEHFLSSRSSLLSFWLLDSVHSLGLCPGCCGMMYVCMYVRALKGEMIMYDHFHFDGGVWKVSVVEIVFCQWGGVS